MAPGRYHGNDGASPATSGSQEPTRPKSGIRKRGSWLALLPNPGLIGPDDLKVKYDFLTAILESMVLAIAESHDSRTQEPLRPYTALRRLFDNAEGPTQGGMHQPVGAIHMARWIHSGATRSGVSVVGSGAEARAPEQRQESVTRWLDDLSSAITRKEQASARAFPPDRSRVIDLADDFRWACARLRDFAVNPPEVPDSTHAPDHDNLPGGLV